MKQIADYIVSDGAFTVLELNGIDTDLWQERRWVFWQGFCIRTANIIKIYFEGGLKWQVLHREKTKAPC